MFCICHGVPFSSVVLVLGVVVFAILFTAVMIVEKAAAAVALVVEAMPATIGKKNKNYSSERTMMTTDMAKLYDKM